MARVRVRTSPIEIKCKKDRYLSKDLSNLSKNRLKKLYFALFSLAISIILNAYLFYTSKY